MRCHCPRPRRSMHGKSKPDRPDWGGGGGGDFAVAWLGARSGGVGAGGARVLPNAHCGLFEFAAKYASDARTPVRDKEPRAH